MYHQHQPINLGDFLLNYTVQVDQNSHSKFWNTEECASFLERVIRSVLANEAIYIGTTTFETSSSGEGGGIDHYGGTYNNLKILDGKNRLLSVYVLARLCACLSTMSDTHYEQLRTRYFETDHPSTREEQDSIDGLSTIADYLGDSDDLDCMMEDSVIAYNSIPRIRFENQRVDHRFSVGANHLSRIRMFSKTQKDPECLVRNTLLAYCLEDCSRGLLDYHYASNRVLSNPTGIKSTDAYDVLLKILSCVRFHVCCISPGFSYQYYKNECSRSRKGILELVSLQLVTVPHSIDPSNLSRQEILSLSSIESKIKDAHAKLLEVLFPMEPDLYYSISNELQTEVAYVASKFLSTDSASVASADDQFLELFFGSVARMIDQQLKIRENQNLSDALVKYSMLELLGTILESYLFVTGCTKETHHLLKCNFLSLSEFAGFADMISLCKLLSYGKFEALYLPCLMAFVCNPVLFSLDDPISLSRFLALVIVLTKLWLAFLIGKSQTTRPNKPHNNGRSGSGSLDHHQQHREEACLKNTSMRKFRDILETISRGVFSCGSHADFGKLLESFCGTLLPVLITRTENIKVFFSLHNAHNFTQWTHTKYLLFLYELDCECGLLLGDSQSISKSRVLQVDYASVGVEHVVPKSKISNHPNSLELSSEYVNSIGNMALATNRSNSAYSTLGFQRKKNATAPGRFGYASSIFPSLVEISRNSQWSHSQIETRCSLIASFVERFLLIKKSNIINK